MILVKNEMTATMIAAAVATNDLVSIFFWGLNGELYDGLIT